MDLAEASKVLELENGYSDQHSLFYRPSRVLRAHLKVGDETGEGMCAVSLAGQELAPLNEIALSTDSGLGCEGEQAAVESPFA